MTLLVTVTYVLLGNAQGAVIADVRNGVAWSGMGGLPSPHLTPQKPHGNMWEHGFLLEGLAL